SMSFMEPNLNAARLRSQAAYDPSVLQAAGHRLADLLARHLKTVQASESVVLPWADPRELARKARRSLVDHRADDSESGGSADVAERFGQLVELALSWGHNLHDPRYVGHQVPP